MTKTNGLAQESKDQTSDDDHHLASFGYRQEMVRTLGSFSTFATGFAFISILTGMFLLFGFAYGTGGPASIWAWIAATIGQLLFALAFAELSVKYPLAGSVYNWTKYVSSPGVAWIAGVSMILALIASCAAVALTMQSILPSISNIFWLYGNGNGPNDATINSVILGTIMLVLTTIVSLSGAKVRSFVNNLGVMVELVASVALVIGLLMHAKRGVSVVFETNGTGAGTPAGYFGVLLVCLLLGLMIMWGFDTAGSVGEETINPRKTSPRAIIRALLASGVFGGLLILTTCMALPDLKDANIANLGLAYVLQTIFGKVIGDIILIAAAIAVFVCGLANQTGAVNMMFAMARDNALPASKSLAHIASGARTPVVPNILVAALSIAILVINVSQPQIILVVTSDCVIFALVSYIMVSGGFTMARIKGRWTLPEKGYFTLGRWGGLISGAAFVWAVVMTINIAWPRDVIYNPAAPFHWYLKWGGVYVPLGALLICYVLYLARYKGRIGRLSSHSSASPVALSDAQDGARSLRSAPEA
ncbi:APC family permease [Paraburkholderia bannensis]|uniref:APC family permease n=1 Tax=Paraburkholderia bannensis TaxID=765414 RepID=UPI002AC34967|nr:APC family permease [Paraburkholderia bannensis]